MGNSKWGNNNGSVEDTQEAMRKQYVLVPV